jgi:hypothetical protein
VHGSVHSSWFRSSVRSIVASTKPPRRQRCTAPNSSPPPRLPWTGGLRPHLDEEKHVQRLMTIELVNALLAVGGLARQKPLGLGFHLSRTTTKRRELCELSDD